LGSVNRTSLPSSIREAPAMSKDILLPLTNELATRIWRESNVRFVHKTADEGLRQITFHYLCAQGVNKAKNPVNDHRDRESMKRGPCNGLLCFAYDRKTNYLLIKASHEDCHPPYVEKSVKAIVKDLISKNVKHSPAQIYRMMLSEEELEEHRVDVSEAQVRYVWHNLTSQIWLRDKDPLL